MKICSECHAGCCRKFHINLTGYDILSIKKTLDLDYPFFLQINQVENDVIEKRSKRNALFKFSDLDSEKYYTFHLRRVKSKYYKDSERCLFLTEWNNTDIQLPYSEKVYARCGIYNSRPLTCAVFPTELHPDGMIGYTSDVNCYTEKSDNPAYNLCPRALNEKDLESATGNMIQTLVVRKYELEYFKSVAKIWNSTPGTYARFFDFLEMAYKNRILYVKPEIKDN